jgi:hypothetical protein
MLVLRIRRRTAARPTLALVLVLAACATPPPPSVAVSGSAADLAALAGTWAGEYHGDASGRNGSIRFTLRAESDSAVGEVVMVPAGSTTPMAHAAPPGEAAAGGTVLGAPAAVLTIRFVRAEGGAISGSLDPYRAPDCACVLTTSFSGTLRGDVIEGTFAATGHPSGERQTGRWRVTRQAR